jgi:hypothetical protein
MQVARYRLLRSRGMRERLAGRYSERTCSQIHIAVCVTPASHIEGTVRQLVPKWQQVEHACFTHLFNL